MRKMIWVLFFVLGNAGVAKEPSPIKKKYILSICAVVRNEAKYIKEWIEFHRIIGVDHFYLYNNNSSDRLYRVVSPYLRKGIVTLISWPDTLGQVEEERVFHWALSTLIPAYENAIRWTPGQESNWLAFLTPDEYLVPIETQSIKELLKKYDSAPGLLLTTEVYDGSKIHLALPKKMMIESTEIVPLPKTNPFKTISKIIVKPEQYEGFLWPPYQILLKNDQSFLELKRSVVRVNRYVNREKSALETMKHKLEVDPRSLAPGEVSHLLESGYVLEDQERAIFRFLPTLKSQFNP